MRLGPRWGWFLGFSAVFAALAAFVFWGCWATGVTFIAPDDPISFLTATGDVFARWWNGFLTTGRMQPTDVLWSGLLGSPLFCRELKYVVAIYCAALGMAYFLRGRGLSRLASYGAGILLAFCGYWFTLYNAGHGGWFIWMTYGVFAFGLIDRAVAGGKARHWLLLGLVVAWGSFHQPDLWLIFTAFTGVYFIFRVLVERPGWKPVARGVAMAGVAFALVGAPSFYDAFSVALVNRKNQIDESKGSALTGGAEVTDDGEARWIFVTNWSLPPDETAEFFNARVNGDTSCPMTLSVNAKKGMRPYVGALGRPIKAKQGNYRQHSLYVGWVTLLLAVSAFVAAIASKVRSRKEEGRCAEEGRSDVGAGGDIAFFAVAAVVFWLFSMGRYCEPVYRVVFSLPLVDYLRAPVKWHHLTEFCLCVLAGFGIAFIGHLVESFAKGRSRLSLAMTCALGAFVVWGAFDLASEARVFCAPVDYSRALDMKCSSELSVLSRQQFGDPQIANMVRRGAIVSVASWLGNPDAFLVQVLRPLERPKPVSPKAIPLTLGIVSVLSALGIAAFSLGLVPHRRSK